MIQMKPVCPLLPLHPPQRPQRPHVQMFESIWINYPIWRGIFFDDEGEGMMRHASIDLAEMERKKEELDAFTRNHTPRGSLAPIQQKYACCALCDYRALHPK